ncbi:thioredoxin domain-containing protein, partial [Amylibacter sp.]|nr:thioredoxin domain-containing protein [Amylibacter sp.]
MKNIKPLYLIPPFIFFILAIIMFIGLGRDKPNELPSAMIGRYAPDLTITPLSSLPFLDKTHLKSSNIKIVNFWASWCAPCRVEHPNIQQLADLGFMVYGINYKDKAPQALQFLNS